MNPAPSPGESSATREGALAFAGHRLAWDPDVDSALRRDMDAVLDRRRPAVGFGSLACGADVLWAEAMLERSVPVHIVLPFGPDDFVETSVRPGGEGWVARHRAVVDAAASVTVVWDGPYHGHDELYGMATDLFLGRALLRADESNPQPCFAVVWDGEESSGPAGTGADVGRWRRAGGVLEVVAPRGTRVQGGGQPRRGPAPFLGVALHVGHLEHLDCCGADATHDTAAKARRAIEATIAAGGNVIRWRSVDEGIVVVGDSVSAAAKFALDLHAAVDGAVTECPRRLGLNLVAHACVMPGSPDALQERTGRLQSDLLRAARAAPPAPSGEVHVTEPFAARLALDAGGDLVTEPVGYSATVDAVAPLYRLRRHPR